MTEDEIVGWHHRLDGHEFEQALGVGDGQGGLACCSPWAKSGPQGATENGLDPNPTSVSSKRCGDPLPWGRALVNVQ